MKISYSWLKEYCPVHLPAEEISKVLTDCGLEVEAIENYHQIKGGLEGIVVGEVLDKKQHPNADRLSITKVDVGTGQELQIVCGASNVDKGQKVVVALVGAVLYPTDGASFQINKSKIRGEVSEGMICAEDEIGLGTSHEGIMILKQDAKVGMPAAEYFDLENDRIFEIGLTPNRSDAASHMGVARDLAAALKFREIPVKVNLKKPEVKDVKVSGTGKSVEVKVEDLAACPRYTSVSLSNVKVEASPRWLQNRLTSIGVKPINNIVDISNFVLHETGHPLHAFDLDKIEGNKIIVKKLPAETQFTTLDGVERKLSQDDLMICDASKPLCIAGVYGGLSSGITAETSNVFLESAYFNPVSVRKTSKHHSLKTDAAFRFERGADPEMTLYALKRAVQLMEEIAGAKVSSDISDIYPEPVKPVEINFSLNYLERLSGHKFQKNLVEDILTSLGMKVKAHGEEWLVEVPAFKADVNRPADLVEEVLRIYGYNQIPLPPVMSISIEPVKQDIFAKSKAAIGAYLSSRGFHEIMNLSLSSGSYYENSQAETISIINPLSQELNVLRANLIFSGLETVAYNQNRKQEDLRLFEFGKVYELKEGKRKEKRSLAILVSGKQFEETWALSEKEADFYFLKGIMEALLERLGISTEGKPWEIATGPHDLLQEALIYKNQAQNVVAIGKVKGALLKKFDIKKPVFAAEVQIDALLKFAGKPVLYEEVPKFPEVRRDLSLLADSSTAFADIKKVITQQERNFLRDIRLFDVYEGKNLPEGKKSYAISLSLQNKQETLTDKQIDKSMERIIAALEKELSVQIRK